MSKSFLFTTVPAIGFEARVAREELKKWVQPPEEGGFYAGVARLLGRTRSLDRIIDEGLRSYQPYIRPDIDPAYWPIVKEYVGSLKFVPGERPTGLPEERLKRVGIATQQMRGYGPAFNIFVPFGKTVMDAREAAKLVESIKVLKFIDLNADRIQQLPPTSPVRIYLRQLGLLAKHNIDEYAKEQAYMNYMGFSTGARAKQITGDMVSWMLAFVLTSPFAGVAKKAAQSAAKAATKKITSKFLQKALTKIAGWSVQTLVRAGLFAPFAMRGGVVQEQLGGKSPGKALFAAALKNWIAVASEHFGEALHPLGKGISGVISKLLSSKVPSYKILGAILKRASQLPAISPVMQRISWSGVAGEMSEEAVEAVGDAIVDWWTQADNQQKRTFVQMLAANMPSGNDWKAMALAFGAMGLALRPIHILDMRRISNEAQRLVDNFNNLPANQQRVIAQKVLESEETPSRSALSEIGGKRVSQYARLAFYNWVKEHQEKIMAERRAEREGETPPTEEVERVVRGVKRTGAIERALAEETRRAQGGREETEAPGKEEGVEAGERGVEEIRLRHPAETGMEAPAAEEAQPQAPKEEAPSAATEKIKPKGQRRLQEVVEEVPEKPAGDVVYSLPTRLVEADPERFQYKEEARRRGGHVPTALPKKWDTKFATPLLVWKDPETGRVYVVDGHHRLALAKKLNVERVPVMFIDAPTAEEARTIGALKNIAEGRGDVLDAAELFRTTGLPTLEAVENKYNIKLSSKLAKDGIRLARLADPIYRAVRRGELPISHALVIADEVKDRETQVKLWPSIAEAMRKKPLSEDELRHFLIFRTAPQATQKTLFGEETQIMALHAARVAAAIKRYLAQNKTAASALLRAGRPELYEKTGMAQVRAERAKAYKEEYARLLEDFDRFVKYVGPLNRLIGQLAKEVAGGVRPEVVVRRHLDEIKEAIKAEYVGHRERAVREGAEKSIERTTGQVSERGGEAAPAVPKEGSKPARVEEKPLRAEKEAEATAREKKVQPATQEVGKFTGDLKALSAAVSPREGGQYYVLLGRKTGGYSTGTVLRVVAGPVRRMPSGLVASQVELPNGRKAWIPVTTYAHWWEVGRAPEEITSVQKPAPKEAALPQREIETTSPREKAGPPKSSAGRSPVPEPVRRYVNSTKRKQITFVVEGTQLVHRSVGRKVLKRIAAPAFIELNGLREGDRIKVRPSGSWGHVGRAEAVQAVELPASNTARQVVEDLLKNGEAEAADVVSLLEGLLAIEEKHPREVDYLAVHPYMAALWGEGFSKRLARYAAERRGDAVKVATLARRIKRVGLPGGIRFMRQIVWRVSSGDVQIKPEYLRRRLSEHLNQAVEGFVSLLREHKQLGPLLEEIKRRVEAGEPLGDLAERAYGVFKQQFGRKFESVVKEVKRAFLAGLGERIGQKITPEIYDNYPLLGSAYRYLVGYWNLVKQGVVEQNNLFDWRTVKVEQITEEGEGETPEIPFQVLSKRAQPQKADLHDAVDAILDMIAVLEGADVWDRYGPAVGGKDHEGGVGVPEEDIAERRKGDWRALFTNVLRRVKKRKGIGDEVKAIVEGGIKRFREELKKGQFKPSSFYKFARELEEREPKAAALVGRLLEHYRLTSEATRVDALDAVDEKKTKELNRQHTSGLLAAVREWEKKYEGLLSDKALEILRGYRQLLEDGKLTGEEVCDALNEWINTYVKRGTAEEKKAHDEMHLDLARWLSETSGLNQLHSGLTPREILASVFLAIEDFRAFLAEHTPEEVQRLLKAAKENRLRIIDEVAKRFASRFSSSPPHPDLSGDEWKKMVDTYSVAVARQIYRFRNTIASGKKLTKAQKRSIVSALQKSMAQDWMTQARAVYGERIKRLYERLQKKGFTKRQIAKELGITQTQMRPGTVENLEAQLRWLERGREILRREGGIGFLEYVLSTWEESGARNFLSALRGWGDEAFNRLREVVQLAQRGDLTGLKQAIRKWPLQDLRDLAVRMELLLKSGAPELRQEVGEMAEVLRGAERDVSEAQKALQGGVERMKKGAVGRLTWRTLARLTRWSGGLPSFARLLNYVNTKWWRRAENEAIDRQDEYYEHYMGAQDAMREAQVALFGSVLNYLRAAARKYDTPLGKIYGHHVITLLGLFSDPKALRSIIANRRTLRFCELGKIRKWYHIERDIDYGKVGRFVEWVRENEFGRKAAEYVRRLKTHNEEYFYNKVREISPVARSYLQVGYWPIETEPEIVNPVSFLQWRAGARVKPPVRVIFERDEQAGTPLLIRAGDTVMLRHFERMSWATSVGEWARRHGLVFAYLKRFIQEEVPQGPKVWDALRSILDDVARQTITPTQEEVIFVFPRLRRAAFYGQMWGKIWISLYQASSLLTAIGYDPTLLPHLLKPKVLARAASLKYHQHLARVPSYAWRGERTTGIDVLAQLSAGFAGRTLRPSSYATQVYLSFGMWPIRAVDRATIRVIAAAIEEKMKGKPRDEVRRYISRLIYLTQPSRNVLNIPRYYILAKRSPWLGWFILWTSQITQNFQTMLNAWLDFWWNPTRANWAKVSMVMTVVGFLQPLLVEAIRSGFFGFLSPRDRKEANFWLLALGRAADALLPVASQFVRPFVYALGGRYPAMPLPFEIHASLLRTVQRVYSVVRSLRERGLKDRRTQIQLWKLLTSTAYLMSYLGLPTGAVMGYTRGLRQQAMKELRRRDSRNILPRYSIPTYKG